MHEVAEERERRGAPGAADDDRLVAGRVAAGRDDRHARQELALAVGPAVGAPVADELRARAGRSSRRAAGCRRARSPTRPAGRRSSPAGRRASRRRARRPPAWSKWRWLIATTSTVAGSKPGRSAAPARSTGPRSRASSRVLSSIRSPIPVSTRTRPAGVSIEQAVQRLEQAVLVVDLVGRPSAPRGSAAPARRGRRRRIGTCPPGRGRPSCRRRGRAASRRRRSAAVARASGSRPAAPRARARSKSRWKADAVGSDWPWYFEPSSGEPYGRSTGRAHLEEADLADLHPEVEGDRQVRDVRQLEGQVALPARVDVARRRVDQQAEAAQATSCPSSLATRSFGQLDPFERLAEHELAGMEDERLVVGDRAASRSGRAAATRTSMYA